jgi:hypothetical protein
MKHHRRRGRRARRKGFHGRAQVGGPPAGAGHPLESVVAERPPAPVDGGVVHSPESPILDDMVSALLEAEAHAAEEKALALAEAQAHIEALAVPVVTEAPVIAGDEAGETGAEIEAEDHDAFPARARRRSVIKRTHVTAVRSRQRLVYVAAGIVVAVLVIAVLSWMEWWDLSSVSLLPPPQ